MEVLPVINCLDRICAEDKLRKIKSHHVISFLVAGGIIFAAASSSKPPLFTSLDQFVLVAEDKIHLAESVQVSSGDLGSNEEINIDKDSIINGNLFADRITIDKNSQINGNVSYNKLDIKKESKIFGTQTKPISLPIVNLSSIPDFSIGAQDFKFTGQNNVLPSGNYKDITLEKNSKLTLTGGTYNLNKLELKENSALIFNYPTTLNIQFQLKGQQKTSILPGRNLSPTDLVINYLGTKAKQEKKGREDDDEEISQFLNDQEKEDLKNGKTGRPVSFGKNSFLNFRLLAPKAKVHIEQESTLRGQILAEDITIGKNSILSRKDNFSKESDPAKVVVDQGIKFVVNEIVVLFQDGATQLDAERIAGLVNGRVTGFTPTPPTYKIELQTNTITDINAAVQTIKNSNNPLIVGVVQNLVSQN